MANNFYDVIIIGGSYSGLSAAMALGRARKKVLVIDDGKPCNLQTPHSHNFLTADGQAPVEIAELARKQVEAYPTVSFLRDLAIKGLIITHGFQIETASGTLYSGTKLIFATGIKDAHPDILNIEACWGISVLHCPFCHGYEVRDKLTGIIGNGTPGYQLAILISNWTEKLTLLTNSPSALTTEERRKLTEHNIQIIEKKITGLEHSQGYLDNVIFKDESRLTLSAIYVRSPFQQTCPIPESIGCKLTVEGYIEVDSSQSTTISGIFACGDNSNQTRTLSNAIASGTTAGMMVSKQLIINQF